MSWKADAAKMYFEGRTVNDIVDITGKSRQAVSGYLNTLPGYAKEKVRRKLANKEKRRKYKRAKNRQYRIQMGVNRDTMKREHDIAAMILSHEKY